MEVEERLQQSIFQIILVHPPSGGILIIGILIFYVAFEMERFLYDKLANTAF